MKTVIVMMSTYNGEKYLNDQVISIINQLNINVELYIRDDGSMDNTIGILKELEKAHHNIHVTYDKNIGWKKSFLTLMKKVPLTGDYYAFADQDDVWLPEKLYKAVELLGNNVLNKVKAYCSNQTFVDEELNKICIKMNKRYKKSNEVHVLVNGYGMGCTEVFSRELIKLYRRATIEYENVSHDVLVSILATYFGSICRDEKSYMLYRQHNENAGSKHMNIIKKIKRSFYFKDVFIVDNARFLKNNYYNLLNSSQKEIVDTVVNISSVKSKIKLIFNKYISRDSILGTIKIKMYILLYRKGGQK